MTATERPTSPRSWFPSAAVLTPRRPWKWPVWLPTATTRGPSCSTSWNRTRDPTDGHGHVESSNRWGDRLDGEQWDTWLLEAEDVAEAIVEQSADYDATVLGALRKGRLRRFLFGSTTGAVQDRAESAVLTVWAERETVDRFVQ
ncbi:MAG: hypothetical protein ACI9YT_000293 [Halobacteriales archaeon]|jgi:hypothetical protein